MRLSHLYPLVLIIVIGILGITAYAHFGAQTQTLPVSIQQATTTPVEVATQNIPASPNVATPAAGTYTTAQIAIHNSAASCWTSINGNVYDVTSWINRHPGGAEAILYLCGRDGTAAFNAQHGGARRPEQELAGFKIGTLAS